MIGLALQTVLTQNATITGLVAGRVYAVQFPQGGVFPALVYNTEGLKRLNCRRPDNTRQGILEIVVFARTVAEMSTLTEAIHAAIDYQDGEFADYSLSFGEGVDDFDNPDEDLKAYYKRIEFPLTAKQLN